jgi:hypothetical protein
LRSLISIGALICMGICTGCGSSRNDPGMTHPDTPMPVDSISGTVTFKGAPLAGVTVTLWLTNTNSIEATATTDASGNYSFSGLRTGGNVPDDYHLWAIKSGFGFYPSVSSGAKVTRADHTGQFEPGVTPTSTFGIPIYLTVIDYVATANNSVSNANFTAYDGTNPVVSLAATGQTVSFTPGDDGDLKKGVGWPLQRYTDNQDGTVTDHVTGLIWLENADCFAPTTWSAAVADANGLASGACGLTDGSTAGQWRLPNLVELESVIDPSASNPALTEGNPFTNVATANYWTSTSYFGGEAGSPTAWVIRMSDGRYINDYAQNVKQSSANGAWAVKGNGSGAAKLQATGLFNAYQAGDDGTLQKGVPLMYPRFIDHGDGTMIDAMTGLVWLKLANCIQGDWTTALAAVNKLTSGQCGLSDSSTAGQWRMPNRKEMQSLADRNQNNEAEYLNFTFFNPDRTVFQAAALSNFMPYSYYWTSTTNAADPTEAWTVFSCDYGVYDIEKSETGFTLAVRDLR